MQVKKYQGPYRRKSAWVDVDASIVGKARTQKMKKKMQVDPREYVT
jgi:hypothetical protein